MCDVENDQNDAAIVDTIVAMARHLELELIAEGMETKKTELADEMLSQHGLAEACEEVK